VASLDQERTAWAVALLPARKLPISVNGLVAVVAWETAEGGGFGNEAQNNPLNTTQDWPGSWTINSDGVRGYATYADGLWATVQTLGYGAYVGILAALKAGADPYATATTVGATPWGTPASLMSACIPEAQAAVAANYSPPQPKETDVFLKSGNAFYQFVTHQGEPWLWQVAANLASTIPPTAVIEDTSAGGWLNRYAGHVLPGG